MDHVHGPQSQRERAGRVFRVCYLLFVFATYGFRQLPDALSVEALDRPPRPLPPAESPLADTIAFSAHGVV